MNISPYRIKQVISSQGEHYALVECSDVDFIYRVSGVTERWKLNFRVQKMVRYGQYVVLLPSQNFCKSYQCLFNDEVSETKIMEKSFILGDGFIVQRSSRGGGYLISDRSIEDVGEFGLDAKSDLLLPNTVCLTDLVMMRDGVIFTSFATGVWESLLKAYWYSDSLTWKEIKFPSSDNCKNHFIRWLGESKVLVASDRYAQYQSLFCWDLSTEGIQKLNSVPKDHIVYDDPQLFLSNHNGYCEVIANNSIYRTGYCKDFCKSDNLLTIVADAPATSQRLWSIQLGDCSKKQSRSDLTGESTPICLTFDSKGMLVSSTNYAFDYTVEDLDHGNMLRFKPLLKVAATIVFIHGGPGICEGQRMRENTLELVNQGFEVISFDATGSSGFGRIFRNRLNNRHGSLDLNELEKILRSKTSNLPIFLWGESYGGYLALKAGIELSEIISGVINFYGVTDWLDAMLDFSNLEGPLKARMYKNFGNPRTKTGREYLRGISILPDADRLTLPVFTIHGSKDKVVPLLHSQKLYEAMINAHSLSRLMILPDEGHEIRGYSNRKKAINETLKFLTLCLNSEG